jgi:hypothetical protein
MSLTDIGLLVAFGAALVLAGTGWWLALYHWERSNMHLREFEAVRKKMEELGWQVRVRSED